MSGSFIIEPRHRWTIQGISEGGDVQPIQGKAVYFVRMDENNANAIDVNVACDSTVLPGEFKDTLESFLDVLYLPQFKQSKEWEKASKKKRDEFIGEVERFRSDIGDTLKSIVGGVKLRKADKKYDADVRGKDAIKEDAAAIKHYEEVLGDWCDTIEQYLEEKQTESNSGGADAGPLTEVEYWRRRMQRLTNITEQLKTKDCKNVIQILTSVTKGGESSADGASYALLRRWKQIDVRITEHANEAKGTSKNMHPCTSQ